MSAFQRRASIRTYAIFLLAGCFSLPSRDTSRLTIGMNEREVLAIFAYPYKINRTVTESGSHEQWIYERGTFREDLYLYFDGGLLSTWQD